MWKALIKLIEKWAYRCDHEWEHTHTTDVRQKTDWNERTYTVFLYVCKKCCKSKRIKNRDI